MKLQLTRNTTMRAGIIAGWVAAGVLASGDALSAVLHFEPAKVDPVTQVVSIGLDLDAPLDLSSLQVDLSGFPGADSVLDATPQQLSSDPFWSTANPGLPPTTVFWFSLANVNHHFDSGPLVVWEFAPQTDLSFLKATAVGYDAGFDPQSGNAPPLSTTAAIPEPSPRGLILGGILALVLGAARRRRAPARM